MVHLAAIKRPFKGITTWNAFRTDVGGSSQMVFSRIDLTQIELQGLFYTF